MLYSEMVIDDAVLVLDGASHIDENCSRKKQKPLGRHIVIVVVMIGSRELSGSSLKFRGFAV